MAWLYRHRSRLGLYNGASSELPIQFMSVFTILTLFDIYIQEALNGKIFPLPQGRLMGGPSAFNGLLYITNARANVDAWGKLGNPGWDWEILSPYYKKYTLTLLSEEKQKELGLEYVDETLNGNSGPIHASFPDALDDPLASAWIMTLRGLGYPALSDPFSGNALGGYINATTINPVIKSRSYAGNAYYEPVSGRENLRAITGALVEKVIFEPSNTNGDVIATGVQYIKDSSS
jgi:choline dehydrogenase-like flavoprotein